jgi:hypothetical protein
MMIREAFNPKTIVEDDLEWGFENTYIGQLREWGQQQGISDELARALWRAHWVEISPTQAYQMFWRLGRLKKDDPLYFPEERLKRVLREADYPPGLIDRLIAIAYLPINRTVAEKEALERLMRLGYSPADAELLRDILFSDKRKKLGTQSGQWTPRKITKEFRAGTITVRQAHDLLTNWYGNVDTA